MKPEKLVGNMHVKTSEANLCRVTATLGNIRRINVRSGTRGCLFQEAGTFLVIEGLLLRCDCIVVSKVLVLDIIIIISYVSIDMNSACWS